MPVPFLLLYEEEEEKKTEEKSLNTHKKTVFGTTIKHKTHCILNEKEKITKK